MKEEMEENRERQTDRPPPAVLKNSLHFSVYQVKISPIKQFFNLYYYFFIPVQHWPQPVQIYAMCSVIRNSFSKL